MLVHPARLLEEFCGHWDQPSTVGAGVRWPESRINHREMARAITADTDCAFAGSCLSDGLLLRCKGAMI